MTRGLLPTAAWVALGGWGALLAARPAETVRAVCGDVPVPPTAVVRVLGARQLLQSAALLAMPSRRLVFGAAAVDALHAASMLAAALTWPRYAKPALASAATATGSAVLTASLGT
jgi:hypothetical protein